MDNNLLSALDSIPVASLNRADWITVGMALKQEGYDVSTWDEWSQADSRYHRGECERLWRGFSGSSTPVTGGSIIKMAESYGWTAPQNRGELAWDDVIQYDGDDFVAPQDTAWNPKQDLITYLSTLFEPDDLVCYVTEVYRNEDGKPVPTKGHEDRTAGQLIEALKTHPLDEVIGDFEADAGAWIRINAMDGVGYGNQNVVKYKYALVESDELPIAEQDALFRRLQLPIVTMVHSGGKSVHALVRVDASDREEYRKRVEYLYNFIEQSGEGIKIDRQNSNPSRLSRMPGVTRNGNKQFLMATNIGKKSWSDWMDYAEGVVDDFPPIISYADVVDNLPPLAEPLIDGILRRGHKMILTSSSKAGKSILLMELALAIAEGKKWLGLQCRKGRVLYINLEIDPASFDHRLNEISTALGWKISHAQDLQIWNLRGQALPLDQLAPKLIRKVRDMHLDAIIFDPIYKIITGDENDASEMGKFCNQFDYICKELGCAAIYCHHHSKGKQGEKNAIDRGSGSGVFGRDADAILDLSPIELTEFQKDMLADPNATAWRLETILREFAPLPQTDIWFEYPLHRVDTTGELKQNGITGSSAGNHSSQAKSPAQKLEKLEFAYASNAFPGHEVTVTDMASTMGVDEKTVRRYINDNPEHFSISKNVVRKLQ